MPSSIYPGCLFRFHWVIYLDGFVKSPSGLLGAGLRFNPAPLDNNSLLGSWDKTPFIPKENPFGKNLMG
jgi:hypothetical protein